MNEAELIPQAASSRAFNHASRSPSAAYGAGACAYNDLIDAPCQIPLPLDFAAAERREGDPKTEQDYPEEYELQPAQSPDERRTECSRQRN